MKKEARVMEQIHPGGLSRKELQVLSCTVLGDRIQEAEGSKVKWGSLSAES